MARKRNPKSDKNKKSQSPIVGYYRPSNRGNVVEKESKKSLDLNTIFTTLKILLQKLLKNVFIVAIVVIALFNTTLSGVSVKVIGNSSGSLRSSSDYNAGISQLLNESFLNSSKITFRSLDFEEQIKQQYPEVTDVSVVVPLAGRKLQIGLQLDNPILRLRTANNQQQGLIGSTGTLIARADTNVILEQFPTVPSISIDPLVEFDTGNQVLTSVEVGLISLLMEEFDGSEPYRPSVESVVFMVQKREINVRFKGVGYFAKLTPERDARPQIGSLVATLKQLKEQGNAPQEYIDVRVEDRVFVK
jgi:hypothetical protein